MTQSKIPDEAREEARQWLRAMLDHGENSQDEDRVESMDSTRSVDEPAA
jgi:hypothetical protein